MRHEAKKKKMQPCIQTGGARLVLQVCLGFISSNLMCGTSPCLSEIQTNKYTCDTQANMLAYSETANLDVTSVPQVHHEKKYLGNNYKNASL